MILSLYSLFLISLALSLDAFGVAICIGLNGNVMRKKKLGFAFSFGFFQFLFALIGSYAGFLFNTYIAAVPGIIGGMVIAIVGIMMIKEGFENKGECPLLKPKMYVVLGVSVSIDAMVIGFTVLNNITDYYAILRHTIFIGVITLIMSTLAFLIARYLRKIESVSKYADYLGGIILILFGLKMIFL